LLSLKSKISKSALLQTITRRRQPTYAPAFSIGWYRFVDRIAPVTFQDKGMESLVETGPQPLANNGPRESSVPYRVQMSASRRVSSDPLDRVLVNACDIPNPFAAHGRGASAKHFANDRRFRWMGRRLIREFVAKPLCQLTGSSETMLLCHRYPLAFFRRTAGGCLMDNLLLSAYNPYPKLRGRNSQRSGRSPRAVGA